MGLFAVVDVETTGGSLQGGSRITEVAVVLHDGEKTIRTYSSLVNPGIAIPQFISNLTGITNEMVESAPSFEDIASELISVFSGSVFVAHNVSFDYSHIKSEFLRCGIKFEAEKICTCKLGRKLLPGYGSYSLKALSRNLGIALNNHHRALSDAQAAAGILEHLVAKTGLDGILNYALPEERPTDVPYHLLENLPEKHGVYFFHDKKGEFLYVGKANNIRKRVLSHFKSNKGFKTRKIKALLDDITYMETGNELHAYLLELQEIKKHKPFFNYAGKNEITYGLFQSISAIGVISFVVRPIEQSSDPALQSFKSKKNADQYLFDNTNRYNLCLCANGLEKSKGNCLFVQTKSCGGVYQGNEPVNEYNARAEKLLQLFEDNMPSVLLLDNGRTGSEMAVTGYKNGRVGYAYFDKDESVTEGDMWERLSYLPASVEYKRIFKSFYDRKKYKKALLLQDEATLYSEQK